MVKFVCRINSVGMEFGFENWSKKKEHILLGADLANRSRIMKKKVLRL